MDLENTTRTRSGGRAIVRPPFIVAVVLLGAAAFGLTPMVLSGGRGMFKLEVPLKTPLHEFKKEGLGPYRFLSRATVTEAVLEQLGTDEFVDWSFEDTDVSDARDPLRFVHIHAPYYTGGRNIVPHVPDNCRRGSGYVIAEADNLELAIPSLDREIPVRAVTFETSSIFDDRPTVVYTFHCNGDFTANRNGVRIRTSSLTERYAYFCKIEVSFGSMASHPPSPDRESAIAAAAKFLDVFLPRLLEDHLPDWKAVKAQEMKQSEEPEEVPSA